MKRPVLRRLACLAVVLTPIALPAGSLARTATPRRAGGRPTTVQVSLTRAPSDPRGNRRLSQATLLACHFAPAGAACTGGVLAAIDVARAAEGVQPMTLPANFAWLNGAQQLLVVTNLERVDRGLVPALGLARSLDGRALIGARNDTDPVLQPIYGNWAGSNWAGGYGSVLEADFEWMYDDGPGSPNLDCPAAGQPGCWGHRHNIIAPYQAPLAMGAAVLGVSMAELFVGHDLQTGPNQADAIMAPRRPAVIRLSLAGHQI